MKSSPNGKVVQTLPVYMVDSAGLMTHSGSPIKSIFRLSAKMVGNHVGLAAAEIYPEIYRRNHLHFAVR